MRVGASPRRGGRGGGQKGGEEERKGKGVGVERRGMGEEGEEGRGAMREDKMGGLKTVKKNKKKKKLY